MEGTVKKAVQKVNPLSHISIHTLCQKGDFGAVWKRVHHNAECVHKTHHLKGTLPLHHAAIGGHEEIMSFLLDNGADINAVDMARWTPLHHAVHYGNYRAAKCLLDRGADFTLQDRGGECAFEKASTAKKERALQQYAESLGKPRKKANEIENQAGARGTRETNEVPRKPEDKRKTKAPKKKKKEKDEQRQEAWKPGKGETHAEVVANESRTKQKQKKKAEKVGQPAPRPKKKEAETFVPREEQEDRQHKKKAKKKKKKKKKKKAKEVEELPLMGDTDMSTI